MGTNYLQVPLGFCSVGGFSSRVRYHMSFSMATWRYNSGNSKELEKT